MAQDHDYFLPAVLFAMLMALFMYAIPLRDELAFWRPPFVMLVVLYWLTVEPYRFGIGAAWLSGLALDLIFGYIPGQNALAVATCAYLVQLSGEGLRRFPLLHQCGMVLMLGGVYQLIMMATELITQRPASTWSMFYASVSAAAVWPLLGWLMRHLYRGEN